MSAFVESPTPVVDRVVSPELALIDSGLAELERARSALLAPRPRVRPHLTWADEETRSGGYRALLDAVKAGAVWAGPRARQHPRALAIGAACLVAAVGFVVPDLLGRLNTPDGAQDAGLLGVAAQAPSSSATTTESAPSDDTARSSGPRRFAWAPVKRADGYHIELFRSSQRVFAADTRKPSITVPATWTYGSRRYALVPGEYAWYVWPRVSGVRSRTAVVQATLAVPAA